MKEGSWVYGLILVSKCCTEMCYIWTGNFDGGLKICCYERIHIQQIPLNSKIQSVAPTFYSAITHHGNVFFCAIFYNYEHLG